MKKTAFAATVLVAGAFGLAVQPVLAQEEEATTAQVATAALTIDSPIEALMANEAAAAILEKHFPGIGAHPAYDQFKAMSLVQLQPFSQGMITEESIATVKTELEAIAKA
jgi:hypothetical protein